ncbi:MAG: alpha-2,8-polysialyltransferase family protein [Xanthomonadales bacterium]|nr:alpha-2,8-polysialyltransferase family protein [Xanthomonadales bacterium]
MERIVFVINTEYHLLVACSLICDEYHDRSRFAVQVVEAGSANSPRRRNIVNRSALGVVYDEWDVDSQGTADGNGLGDRVNSLLEAPIDTLVIFLEHHPLNILLAQQVRRKVGTVALAPDGVRPYYQLNFGALRQLVIRFKRFFQVRSELRALNLPHRFPYLPRNGYGEAAYVDQIWAVHPEHVKNRSGKPVRRISVLSSAKAWDTAAALFDFEPGADTGSAEKVAFYVNNLLYDEQLYDEEIKVLRHLYEVSGGRLFIKLHPQTPAVHRDRMAATGATLIETSIPAELYIARLRHSIVVSGWSASLTIENPSCHFYWLTEYFRELGCMYAPIDLVNPTTYIHEARNLDDIVFPSGG